MTSRIHLTLRLAATAGMVVALNAAPALAAESTVPATEISAAAVTRGVPSITHHRSARAIRNAASGYRDHRVSSVRSDLGCSGVWCGRQFVLMIGISY